MSRFSAMTFRDTRPGASSRRPTSIHGRRDPRGGGLRGGAVRKHVDRHRNVSQNSRRPLSIVGRRQSGRLLGSAPDGPGSAATSQAHPGQGAPRKTTSAACSSTPGRQPGRFQGPYLVAVANVRPSGVARLRGVFTARDAAAVGAPTTSWRSALVGLCARRGRSSEPADSPAPSRAAGEPGVRGPQHVDPAAADVDAADGSRGRRRSAKQPN